MATHETESSGVQDLIDQLQEQGVERGKEEAEKILAAAQHKANAALQAANTEAERILADAREEARRTKAAGEDALRIACRDAVLKLQEAIGEDFESKVRHLVSHTLGDREFLKKLILAVAGKTMVDTDGAAEVLLPGSLATVEELQSNPEDLKEGTLSHFVLGLSGDILREGLSFGVSADNAAGVRVRLVDDDVEIELTEETITALLMKHLVPRFQAIMLGENE